MECGRTQLSVLFAAAMTLATAGLSSEGTITFTGAVTGNSCAIHVNGMGSDGVVALPVVDTAALDNASAPRDAAGTFFSITVGGCFAHHADISDAAPSRVAIFFEAGPTVDQATHGLINSGTSNVEVKLYLASTNQVVGVQVTPGIVGSGQSTAQPVADATTQHFYAGYSLADGATARAGTVSTSVTYSLIYY